MTYRGTKYALAGKGGRRRLHPRPVGAVGSQSLHLLCSLGAWGPGGLGARYVIAVSPLALSIRLVEYGIADTLWTVRSLSIGQEETGGARSPSI